MHGLDTSCVLGVCRLVSAGGGGDMQRRAVKENENAKNPVRKKAIFEKPPLCGFSTFLSQMFISVGVNMSSI